MLSGRCRRKMATSGRINRRGNEATSRGSKSQRGLDRELRRGCGGRGRAVMTTRMVFVDDSKQKGSRDGMGSLVSLGAVAFDAAQVQPWARAVTNGLVALGCPPRE